MERGTILWGVAGLLAGFFIAKNFPWIVQFSKSINPWAPPGKRVQY